MVQRSQSPGRVRLEETSLIGNLAQCRFVQERLELEVGISEAEVNYRTGRLLVRFDEHCWNVDRLKERFQELLSEETDKSIPFRLPAGMLKSNKKMGSMMVNVFSQLILPKPYNKLVPLVYKGVIG